MYNVDVKQAANFFPDLIDQTLNGNEIIITKEGRPVVKLTAIEKKQKRKRRFGSAKGLIKMADDFADTPEEFRDYM